MSAEKTEIQRTSIALETTDYLINDEWVPFVKQAINILKLFTKKLMAELRPY
jgi:hypothetical protein